MVAKRYAKKCNKSEIITMTLFDESFVKSKTKCPKPGNYKAFTVGDTKTDEVITIGYIRSRWTKSGMHHHLFPPQHLLRIHYLPLLFE